MSASGRSPPEAGLGGKRTLAVLDNPEPLFRPQLSLQVGWVKLGAFHERMPSRHANNPLMPLDQTVRPETLKSAIDVNGGQRGGLCKLRLGYRQVENEVVPPARRVKTGRHFTKQMRNSRLRVAPPDVDDPL